MGWLRDFGSRNHPLSRERRRRERAERRAALDAVELSDEELATFTAARGFLMAEWLGACLMVASVVLLYLFATPLVGLSAGWSIAIAAALLALGGWTFWANHLYYRRLDFPWARRWDATAMVVAGAGLIFWVLFALLVLLAASGVEILRP